MKSAISQIRVLFITVFFSLTFYGCITYQEIEFKGIESFMIGNPLEKEIPIYLDVRINNPNTYNININKAIFDVYIKNTHLGKSTITKRVVLEKGSDQTYPIIFNTTRKAIGNSFLSSLGMILGRNVNIRIKGVVFVKALGIRKKFDLDVKEAVNISEMLNK